jgi:D-alanine-D-alanine ligase
LFTANFTVCLPKSPQIGVWRALRAPGCRGVSRTDFRCDESVDGGLVCLKVNTQPGRAERSLAAERAPPAGMSFDERARWMVEDASLNR